MKGHLNRKARGQSTVLIAMMIVVLLGMVGLAVDVGNTYAEQRSTVRATNAASIAAMDVMIRGGSDAGVAQAIRGSFQSNGIQIQDDPNVPLTQGQRRVESVYLDVAGNPIGNCRVGYCLDGIPTGAAYVQVNVNGLVDTYFARVVGTRTLPVNARAFAGRCWPTENTYPIAISSADLDKNGFVPPSDEAQKQFYGLYSDNTLTEPKTQRRIYLKENMSAPGSFSWLAWKGDSSYTNENGLQAMMEKGGNLSKGFQEVTPWPDAKDPAPTKNGVVVYPQYPNQIGATDWIFGNKGLSWSTDLKAALQFHVDNRTKMNLPIVSKVVTVDGVNAFYMQRMGTFYLRGFSQQGGANASLDLVYLGDSSEVACLVTNLEQIVNVPGVPTNSLGPIPNSLGIDGTVWLYPRWKELTQPNQPVAFVFILDVSGSMSWNFDGYGTKSATINKEANSSGGKDYLCENPDNPNPSGLPYTDTCNGGPNDPWRKFSERRIVVARDAIKNFIDRMDDNDTMKIVSFSTDESATNGTKFSEVAPTGDWAIDKAKFRTAADTLGRINSDRGRTSGGTPGANGVAQARNVLETAPNKAPNGKEYKKVVIYLTDGVANQWFPNGGRNDATDICPGYGGDKAQNVAFCQIGITDGGRMRPITAMIDQADQLRADDEKTAVFSVALGPVDATGLNRVASGDDYSYQARSPGDLTRIFNQIYQAIEGPCVASSERAINRILDENKPDLAKFPNLSADVLGYVYLYDQNEQPLPTDKGILPIRQDEKGVLSFSVPPEKGLAPGTYIMKAYVGYKGKDGVSRQYDSIIDQSTLKPLASWSFVLTPSDTLGKVVPLKPVFLDLPPGTNVCN